MQVSDDVVFGLFWKNACANSAVMHVGALFEKSFTGVNISYSKILPLSTNLQENNRKLYIHIEALQDHLRNDSNINPNACSTMNDANQAIIDEYEGDDEASGNQIVLPTISNINVNYN